MFDDYISACFKVQLSGLFINLSQILGAEEDSEDERNQEQETVQMVITVEEAKSGKEISSF